MSDKHIHCIFHTTQSTVKLLRVSSQYFIVVQMNESQYFRMSRSYSADMKGWGHLANLVNDVNLYLRSPCPPPDLRPIHTQGQDSYRQHLSKNRRVRQERGLFKKLFLLTVFQTFQSELQGSLSTVIPKRKSLLELSKMRVFYNSTYTVKHISLDWKMIWIFLR